MTKFKNVSMLKQIKKKITVGVTAAIALSFALGAPLASAQSDEKVGWPEKEELKFGFIKLTDMAPLAIAYEKGFLKMKACM